MSAAWEAMRDTKYFKQQETSKDGDKLYLNGVRNENKLLGQINRDIISLQQYNYCSTFLHIIGMHYNPIVQTKPVDQHLTLVLCKSVGAWTVQISGSLTAQSKTGQECRNIFFGLV